MRRPVPIRTLLAVLMLAVAVSACGNSTTTATQADDSAGPATVVAQVDGTSITRGELSHWMSTLLGGDFDESVGRPAPRHLVSEPANYPACVSAVESLGSSKEAGASPQQSHAQAQGSCEQLHAAVKRQALSYLINGLWTFKEAAQHGIVVTNAEVEQYLQKVKAARYPSERAFAVFLARREWSLADELYLLKRDLYMTRLNIWRERTLRKTVKGSGASFQQAVIELYARELEQWPAKTSCRPGYVVAECKQSKKPPSEPPSPDLLLERIVASR
jgi:hypothetical protein